jgi:CheY-like chemotaxis protein
MRGGNETILLAEDDAFLRASACKALSQLGYRVLEASNGIEALEIWRQHRDEIHLLLTDLVMPGGMTGKDLAGRLLKENPKLKVIYASGYSAEVVGGDFPLEEGVNFLAKPYQMFKLAQIVRQNLDATSSLHDRNYCTQTAIPDEALTSPAMPSARASSKAASSRILFSTGSFCGSPPRSGLSQSRQVSPIAIPICLGRAWIHQVRRAENTPHGVNTPWRAHGFPAIVSVATMQNFRNVSATESQRVPLSAGQRYKWKARLK